MAYGQALQQAGDARGAVAELEKAVQGDENNDNLAQLASAYASAGRRADADRVIAKLAERRKAGFVPAASFAIAHAALKDKEQTLHWLEAGLEDHSEGLLFLKMDMAYDFIRHEPRFQAVLRRVGLDRR